MKRILNILYGISLVFAISIAMVSCTQETYEDQIRITSEMLDASFTTTPDTANIFHFSANGYENIMYHEWDVDNGLGYVRGRETIEASYVYAGEYLVKHRVAGAGGVLNIDSIIITVETSLVEEPSFPNLVEGGNFETASDIALWSVGATGSQDGVWTFENNKATLTAPAWAGRGIYQAIEVQAGVSYQIDMMVSSTTGCVDTWFEVYCGYTDPATVSEDYSEGGKLLEISTWAGTGTAAFAQKFTTIEPNAGPKGVFTATATGTVYLVIRGGGGDMKDGISVTNVEMRAIPPVNLALGGTFETEDDIAKWSIGGTGSLDGVWTFENNKATLTAPAWAGRGIYQAIEVVAGASYQIDMMVSSTSGCIDTWFEVYCGYTDPATVSEDYSEGGKLLEISTWAGTGTAAFAQKFTTITPNAEPKGVFTATTTGTVYLVIRGGGGEMKDGISVTDVEFKIIIAE